MADPEGSDLDPRLLIDLGTSPEIYADGLAHVRNLGSTAEFLLYRMRWDAFEQRQFRYAAARVILPIPAIGPAIEMTLCEFGTALLLPAVKYTARRLLM